MASPEELAREKIDNLSECGWTLAANKRRALIQMATGSGKTYTAVNFVYRLIKLAGARRVLFLVDRGNLGDQTLLPRLRDQQFVTPDEGRKFTELYNGASGKRCDMDGKPEGAIRGNESINAQHLQSPQLDRVSRVCISTIQRLYSMLRSFVFIFLEIFTARRDQCEETGRAFCAIHKACATHSVTRIVAVLARTAP